MDAAGGVMEHSMLAGAAPIPLSPGAAALLAQLPPGAAPPLPLPLQGVPGLPGGFTADSLQSLQAIQQQLAALQNGLPAAAAAGMAPGAAHLPLAALTGAPEAMAAALMGDPFAQPLSFVVGDRRVYVENGSDPPSVYTMARRWTFNDGGPVADQSPPPPAPSGLPAPAAPVGPDLEGPPSYPADSEETDPVEALRGLKQHWVAVRQYQAKRRRLNSERFTARLATLLPPAPPTLLGDEASTLPPAGLGTLSAAAGAAGDGVTANGTGAAADSSGGAGAGAGAAAALPLQPGRLVLPPGGASGSAGGAAATTPGSGGGAGALPSPALQ